MVIGHSRNRCRRKRAAYVNRRHSGATVLYQQPVYAFKRYTSAAFLLVFLGMVVLLSSTAFAKEYNKPSQISPEQRAKIDKTIAKAKNTSSITEGAEKGAIISDGVVNTNCGELSIGHVDVPKYGTKRLEVDRDIIITGDVINVPTNCRKQPK